MGKYKPYEKYKNSGIPWLGEIPEHWEASKIKWLTPVKRGASPRPIDNPIYFSKDGEFSWVRIADVSASRRYLKKTKEKLSDLGASLSVKQYPNDLFLSIAGTVGKPIITKIKCCIHDGFVYFPNLKLNPEYLFYIFTTGIPYQGLGKMGTQLNLNTETVGSITIPLPSNEEIEQIVSFLDYKLAKINRFIRKKKQLIKLLNEQKAAIINQAVTKGLDPNAGMKDSGIEWLGEIPQHWEVRKLKYVAKIFNGSECDKQIEGLYPVYGSGGVFGYHSDY
ncbi:MAG: restriction endonuclease subunit S, partial [Chitinophagaceae bacterium]|nr:restriction endonuclease subunit S [Chitinophagaceae bacterium]